MDAWMHGCMDAWMYVCTYVCMYACMYACMLLCIYAPMHLCIFASMHVCVKQTICVVKIVDWNSCGGMSLVWFRVGCHLGLKMPCFKQTRFTQLPHPPKWLPFIPLAIDLSTLLTLSGSFKSWPVNLPCRRLHVFSPALTQETTSDMQRAGPWWHSGQMAFGVWHT